MSYIFKADAIYAVAEYIRNEHVKQFNKARLSMSEYIGIAEDIFDPLEEFKLEDEWKEKE